MTQNTREWLERQNNILVEKNYNKERVKKQKYRAKLAL